MKLLARLYLIVLALIGLGLAAGGAWLISLGGSIYYLAAGILYIVAAFLA